MTDVQLIDWINTALNGGGLGLAAVAVWTIRQALREREGVWTILVHLIEALELEKPLRKLVPPQFQSLFND